MITLIHLGDIERKDPKLADTLRTLMNGINQTGTSIGVDPVQSFPAPTAPTLLNVTSVDGGFDISITDPNAAMGLNYFVDHDTQASFGTARTLFLGPTRNIYVPLGAQTLFWRCHSQFQGSEPSAYVYFGGKTPQSITGGTGATPTLQPTQGTGAGVSRGNDPFPIVGGGFGVGNRPQRPKGL